MISALLFSVLATTQAKPATAHVDIKDDTVGTGPTVKDGDIVAVDYSGTLLNGTEFDSTAGKEPIQFMIGVGQGIKGWDMGLTGMRAGGKRELTIPPSLAYGDKAVDSIPANSTLHFTVTLLHIEPKIQVEIIAPGKGVVAKLGDRAAIYFAGGVKGGKTLFDTRDNGRKDPITLQIGERDLPIGFMASLIGMREGEKRKVTIPPQLAYGKAGVPPKDKGDIKAGSVIPPDSTMEFTFELVKIERDK
jgi:FKBP-type peptidyl-prolyl cis-trans isomerase